MYIRRALEPLLEEALSQFPAVLITGPRQAGKSTLLHHCLKDLPYVTLDHPLIRKMAVDDPELFLSTYSAPLIIDEIQYAPHLFSYLKLHIDAKRQEYGRYVLTGSQTFQLMKGVSESLAGRIAILQLYPLSWTELSESPPKDSACIEQMIRGFYPQLQLEPHLNWDLWYGSYVSTYLERDVRNIKAITDLSRFQAFLSSLAVRAGQLLNMADLAKECSISEPTVRDWLTILESTSIIFLLRPYHSHRTKRFIKSPKVFFVDTGLLCYLLGIDTSTRLLRSGEKGHIFENMVVAEMRKRAAYRRTQHCNFFFYRSRNDVEVDLLIETQGALFAYEIKFSKTIRPEMVRPLETFLKDHPVQEALLLSLYEEQIPLTRAVRAQHWSTPLQFCSPT